MKFSILILLLSNFIFVGCKRAKLPVSEIIITTFNEKTGIKTTKEGAILVNVLPTDLNKFKQRGYIYYNELGAKGDGKSDDIDFIAATHAVANQYKLDVKANKNESYYIGGKERTVIIQTNTDFGTARFFIDDTKVKNRKLSIFNVCSKLQAIKINTINSLKKNQQKIKLSLPRSCVVNVTNARVKRFIRFGPNENKGTAQTDIFIVDKDGNIDSSTPIIWDFNQITAMTARPIDNKPLTISGGIFTTIANKAKSEYEYYKRNIIINRSNVIVKGLKHTILNEGSNSAPYKGFISIQNAAKVTIQNTRLTGHKTYLTKGKTNTLISMGSYDISVTGGIHVSFMHCDQTNDIHDTVYWGIMESNYSKNLLFDNCKLSRFDAHMGVRNATIINSTLGYMGINVTGSGILRVENTTIKGSAFINLRDDYGSTWQGEIFINNCVFIPLVNDTSSTSIIRGTNTGRHNFGYTCYMPERIIIKNFRIEDSQLSISNLGTALFSDFNSAMKSHSYYESFPYRRTKKVLLQNITTTSGLELQLSDNPYFFRELTLIKN